MTHRVARTFTKLTPTEQEQLRPMLTHCPVRTLNPRKAATPMLVAAHRRAVQSGQQDCACKGAQ